MESKRSTNLCSTYMLPLLGLNKTSFGEPSNFLGSYLSDEEGLIIAQMKRAVPSLKNHSHYKFDFERDESSYFVFGIPTVFIDTVEKFREGKFSQFSDAAKTQIKIKSGLIWKLKQPNGKYKNAVELLALDRDAQYREFLEKELSLPHSPIRIAEEAELISIPGDDNFMKLNLTRSTDLAIM